MQQLKWIFARFADALGLPGLFSLVLVLGLLLFFPLSRWPAQQRLAAAEAAASMKPDTPSSGSAESPASAFLGKFPRPETLPQQLQAIFDTAEKYGLALDEVAYRKLRKPDERLERYLVDFALEAPYPDTRTFLGDVLASSPSIALDQLSLVRDNVQSGHVRAHVRLTLFLVR
ncbi:MAG: hypothetical protein ABI475_04045 [Methylophilaceae bacterium]